MEQWDFEDFVEEVKFQMTEFDNLTEEKILEWEEKVRQWLKKHNDKKGRIVKRGEDILIQVKDEELMERIARKYYHAVKDQDESTYWNKFQLFE